MARTIHLRYLHLNTYLMGGLAPKPALHARCHEIGRIVRDYFDIAALSEVWRREERHLLLGEWPGRRPYRAWDRHRGPGMRRSSGLMTLSTGAPFARNVFRAFREQGVPPDSFARKGMLLAALRLPGTDRTLELFSTHLAASGQTQDYRQRATIRLRQLDELAGFIREHHRPGHACLVAGDFNLDADDARLVSFRFHGEVRPVRTTPYAHLVRVMEGLGLTDLWRTTQGSAPGPTSRVHKVDALGRIIGDHYGAADPTEPTRCHEPGPPGVGETARIDYVFALRDAEPGAPIVTVDRLWRARFARAPDAWEYDRIGFVSDHFGLQAMLRVDIPS